MLQCDRQESSKKRLPPNSCKRLVHALRGHSGASCDLYPTNPIQRLTSPKAAGHGATADWTVSFRVVRPSAHFPSPTLATGPSHRMQSPGSTMSPRAIFPVKVHNRCHLAAGDAPHVVQKWMHQLGRDERLLNGDKLCGMIQKLLSQKKPNASLFPHLQSINDVGEGARRF